MAGGGPDPRGMAAEVGVRKKQAELTPRRPRRTSGRRGDPSQLAWACEMLAAVVRAGQETGKPCTCATAGCVHALATAALGLAEGELRRRTPSVRRHLQGARATARQLAAENVPTTEALPRLLALYPTLPRELGAFLAQQAARTAALEWLRGEDHSGET